MCFDGRMPSPLTSALDRLYATFAGYPCPRQVWVCSQCGPEWSADDIRATPLRALTGAQLEALHITSLDDDSLRHFFPRLLEVLMTEPKPAFELCLSMLKGRLPAWTGAERAGVRDWSEELWHELLTGYPPALGYLSDGPALLSFLNWCDIDPAPFLERWLITEGQCAARHLGDLVTHTLTSGQPFGPATKAQILGWLPDPRVGQKLQDAFFAADTSAVADELSAAHELWTFCGPH